MLICAFFFIIFKYVTLFPLNMIIKLLGFLDLLTALVVFLIQHDYYNGWRFPVVCFMYLAFKAYAYKGDVASLIDGVAGIYFIFLIFGLSNIVISYLVIIYLVQKALMSLSA
tara:strand:+ start:931 stop:1266 length:336 start_codon:yes stop_codon:yes gene_type:complete